MRIPFSAKEQQICATYRQRIADAEAARAQLAAICTIIIERAGGDASTPWQLSQDGSALEEVSDAVAE